MMQALTILTNVENTLAMDITLNHTIIPSKNKIKSAKFYEKIFGFEFIKEWDGFAVVKVNSTLTLDIMHQDNFTLNHYAFKVSDAQFDEIFGRIKEENMPYGAGHQVYDDGKINNFYGGRGVYFRDLDGHILEIMTVDYDLELES